MWACTKFIKANVISAYKTIWSHLKSNICPLCSNIYVKEDGIKKQTYSM